ncbi:unnamed protein product [Discosporangium mesarthrocarpum]
MVRKGLSAEEKASKLLSIYQTTKKVFTLKDIEKAGAKQGIVLNTIKEVNQTLVDDGLVDMDKIGSSNFFWSFPSKMMVARRNLVNSLKEEIKEVEDNIVIQKRKAEELEADRVDTAERRVKLQRLQDASQRMQELEKEFETLKENDPAILEKATELLQVCKDGVNRWTDNTWAIKSWMVKKKGMAGSNVDRFLQIKSDFDYV